MPDAALVFDLLLRSTIRAAFGWLSPFGRPHTIKLANEKIDEIRRGLQRTLELDGQKFIKGTRYLLLYGKENCRRTSVRSWRRRSPTTSRSPKPAISRRNCASSGINRVKKRRRSIC